MAHTCDQCGVRVRAIVAPTTDGGHVVVKNGRFGTGSRGHDTASWKATTRCRKQYLRHPRRAAN